MDNPAPLPKLCIHASAIEQLFYRHKTGLYCFALCSSRPLECSVRLWPLKCRIRYSAHRECWDRSRKYAFWIDYAISLVPWLWSACFFPHCRLWYTHHWWHHQLRAQSARSSLSENRRGEALGRPPVVILLRETLLHFLPNAIKPACILFWSSVYASLYITPNYGQYVCMCVFSTH